MRCDPTKTNEEEQWIEDDNVRVKEEEEDGQSSPAVDHQTPNRVFVQPKTHQHPHTAAAASSQSPFHSLLLSRLLASLSLEAVASAADLTDC